MAHDPLGPYRDLGPVADIAPMANPWTISGERRCPSRPERHRRLLADHLTVVRYVEVIHILSLSPGTPQ